ncbi:hypothetical protein TNCV_271781 [Trichonephila clavipes]|nr:hypothetical protein TNCV_271781 [Trichonephila clavipes]
MQDRKCRSYKLWGKEADKNNRYSDTLISITLYKNLGESSSYTTDTTQRSSVNVWADILVDYHIGPYLISSSLDGRTYLIFLRQVLPELLDAAHVPLS